MTQFIELTMIGGKTFLANVNQIDEVSIENGKHRTYISGLTNNGGFYIEETYEEVIAKLKEISGIIGYVK
jgi:uncharacterized protein YlzI (FlbEa/FlbD family)